MGDVFCKIDAYKSYFLLFHLHIISFYTIMSCSAQNSTFYLTTTVYDVLIPLKVTVILAVPLLMAFKVVFL
jgi:hypothetical protein